MNSKSIDDAVISRITPSSLGAYAVAQGWKVLEQHGNRGTIFVLDSNTPSITVPGSADFAEYTQFLRDIIEVFTIAEDRDELSVIRDLTLADMDQVRVRVIDSDEAGSIPIEAGVTLIHQSRNMLWAAARSVWDPKPVFRGRTSKRVTNYIKRVRLGQTEQGSFVARLLSPVHDPNASRHREINPFARRVTDRLVTGLQATRESLSIADGHYGVGWFEDGVQHGMSANLCDAVESILRSSGGTGLDISVSWSITRPVDEGQVSVSFDASDLPSLEYASRVLKGIFSTSSLSGIETTPAIAAPAREAASIRGEQHIGYGGFVGVPDLSSAAYGAAESGVSLRIELTKNEREWLDEYSRRLRERFPGLIEDIYVYTLDEDDPSPELQALILIRSGGRVTEREVSMLGHMIDMSGYFVAPLIKVFTMEEWTYRERINDPIYGMVVRAKA